MESVLEVLKTSQPDECLGGDPAFDGLEADLNCSVITAPKKQPGKKLTTKQQEFKTEWKTIRTVIENYFSQIKDFKILRYTFRIKGDLSTILESHHRVFIVCSYLMDVILFPKGTKQV